ncbi:MAG: apolipoprotein N-acyltransferase [Aquincola sp.]|nr:apolipoprotein N-acyltransferase [Aquincola sp.]MDH5329634.1 apolipoprotein N-acyltransferase [Aquincola sp.]
MRIDRAPHLSAAPLPLSPAVDAGLAALVGALFSLSFAHASAWWVQFACIGVLAWRAADARPGRAALLGWAFGTAWLAASTWWLFISMHRYGDLSAPLAALAVAVLSAALALYLAAALALFARLRRGDAATDALLFAGCWLLAELARGVLFTGFPWAATGYGQVDAPLAALAPWVGVYGIGLVVAALAALPALQHGRERWWLVAVVGGLVLASPLAHRDFTAPAGRLGVTLIQTNVAQDEKFAPDRLPDALAWLELALKEAPGPLVLAPETAVPLLPDQFGAEAWQRLVAPFQAGPRAALIGVPLGSFEAGYTNSVAGLSKETQSFKAGFYRYDKQHLVPFGEFIPTGFRWFTELMNIPLGDFSRGPVAPPSFEFAGQRIGPTICYEDLFGEELAQRFAGRAPAPTILANLSNIGWFGNTVAVEHHLQISRMRSLELQLPMIRATNTGATAAIDDRGLVVAQMAPFVRGTLQAEVEGRVGLTPFARWAGAFGLWPLVLAAAALIAGCGRFRKRRR